jgi:hypothetical protein
MTIVDEFLDEIAPVHGWSGAWPDVLRRAGEGPAAKRERLRLRTPRGRLLLAALLALVVVAVPLVAVAASNDWWFLKHANEASKPEKAPVVVKEGDWNGKAWDLVAYPNPRSGLCWGITPRATRDTGTGGALGCAAVVGFGGTGRNPAMPITFLSGSASPELPAYVAGPVISTAVKVVIRFATARIETGTFAAPKELGELRFYAVQVPNDVNPARPPKPGNGFTSPILWLAGYDTNGRIVACLNPSTAKDGISSLGACH